MSDEPVLDWATDFDVISVEYQHDPFPIWDEIRSGACPVAHTDRRGGAVLPTTWDDIAAVAYDPATFSSTDVGVLPIPPSAKSLLFAPPISVDPPLHTESRRILLPHFSPKATERLEPYTRASANALLDAIEARGGTADAAGDFAQYIPVRVIAHLLGLPPEEEEMFTSWAIDIFQEGNADPERRRQTTKAILAYFEEQVAARREHPGDDLISALLRSELDGAPLSNKHILGTCFLLLMAGIDTTWSSIGASLWHLATHPADRDRLVAEPELLPTAIEEFLRAYAPVTMGRVATQDTEIGGCPVHAGDKVLLAFPAGNRDPDKFDRPNEVVIDRARNRHFAFGIGIHRCLGSNLARMELQVAVGAWLARFPRFELAPGADVRWAGAQVRGPRAIPVVLDPA